jgi:hypothetical protein
MIKPEHKPFSSRYWEITPVKKIKGNPERVSGHYKTARFIHANFYKSISKLL